MTNKKNSTHQDISLFFIFLFCDCVTFTHVYVPHVFQSSGRLECWILARGVPGGCESLSVALSLQTLCGDYGWGHLCLLVMSSVWMGVMRTLELIPQKELYTCEHTISCQDSPTLLAWKRQALYIAKTAEFSTKSSGLKSQREVMLTSGLLAMRLRLLESQVSHVKTMAVSTLKLLRVAVLRRCAVCLSQAMSVQGTPENHIVSTLCDQGRYVSSQYNVR